MLKPFSKMFWRTVFYKDSKFHSIVVQLPSHVTTLCDLMNCSIPGFPVLHYFPEFAQTYVHWITDAIQSNHLTICCPFLLPSVFHKLRDLASESSVHIRWSEYWSFSISPSSEYSGLISFRIDWFDIAVQGTLKSLL